MNKRACFTFLVLGLFLFLDSRVRSAADEPPGLYTNDFATDPLLSADGLQVSDASAVTWSKDGVRNGKGALKLTNNDKAKNVTAFGSFIPFTGGKLTVSVEARTDKVTSGTQVWEKASVQIFYFDQDKKMIDYKWKSYSDTIPLPNGTADWDTYDKICFFPATTNVAYIRVCYCMLRTTGTAWIDRISIKAQP